LLTAIAIERWTLLALLRKQILDIVVWRCSAARRRIEHRTKIIDPSRSRPGLLWLLLTQCVEGDTRSL
jgi:hypothetical protein